MFDWDDTTDIERDEILTNEWTVGVSPTKPLERRSFFQDGGRIYYGFQPDDYAADLRRWESESRRLRLTPAQLARIAHQPDHNAAGPIPDSRLRRASRLLDHYAPLAFVIARELAELYALDDRQHFLVWRVAWQTLLTVLTDHREHPDPACNEWLLEQALLDTMFDKVVEIFEEYEPDPQEFFVEDEISDAANDPQEYLILRGRREGKTSREIARDCGVDKSTVNRRLLEIRSRYELN